MSVTTVGLALSLFAASVIQTAMGFGVKFALLPLMLAMYPKADTVVVLLALGLLINLLILLVGGSRPHLNRHGLIVLLLWTVPGVLLGIGLLGMLSGRQLQAAAGMMVLAMVAGRLGHHTEARHRHHLLTHHAQREHPHHLDLAKQPALTGLAGGVFTATTSLNGPLVSAHLINRGMKGQALRDQTVAYAFGANVLAVIILFVKEPVHTGAVGSALFWMTPVVLAGFFAGRSLFKHMTGHRYEPVVLGAVAIAGALALALAIT
jgi:uncharacterized membrane protein YfcA